MRPALYARVSTDDKGQDPETQLYQLRQVLWSSRGARLRRPGLSPRSTRQGRKVVELGAEPFCQPVVSLNSLDGRPRVRYDWTEGRLKDFARYFNRFLWKYTPIAEYSNRQGERPPFAGVL